MHTYKMFIIRLASVVVSPVFFYSISRWNHIVELALYNLKLLYVDKSKSFQHLNHGNLY